MRNGRIGPEQDRQPRIEMNELLSDSLALSATPYDFYLANEIHGNFKDSTMS